jgi:hypothetical protein
MPSTKIDDKIFLLSCRVSGGNYVAAAPLDVVSKAAGTSLLPSQMGDHKWAECSPPCRTKSPENSASPLTAAIRSHANPKGIDKPSTGLSMPKPPPKTSFARPPRRMARDGRVTGVAKSRRGGPFRPAGDMSGAGHPIGSRRYKSPPQHAANDKHIHAHQRVAGAAGITPCRPCRSPAGARPKASQRN